MPVNLHFVAKPGRGPELAERLRERGFESVRVVAGDHVVVSAAPSEIREHLSPPSEQEHEQEPEPERECEPGASAEPTEQSSESRIELPDDIDALVERAYRPLPAERFER